MISSFRSAKVVAHSDVVFSLSTATLCRCSVGLLRVLARVFFAVDFDASVVEKALSKLGFPDLGLVWARSVGRMTAAKFEVARSSLALRIVLDYTSTSTSK